jgi:hypothetical protein
VTKYEEVCTLIEESQHNGSKKDAKAYDNRFVNIILDEVDVFLINAVILVMRFLEGISHIWNINS